MRASLVIIPVISVLGFAACLKRPQSQLSHDAGKPVVDPYGKQWHVASDAEYVELVNAGSPLGKIDSSKILAAADPLTMRVQSWIDAIDGMLRQNHAAALKDVPKPVAKITKSSTPNAFVMDNKMCLDYSVEFEGANGENVVEKLLFDRQKTAIDSANSCTKTKLSLDDQRAYLEWWVKPFTGCTLKFSGNVATASAGCAKYLPTAVSEGQTIVVQQTSHFVSFYTEIFRHLTETEMVSVVAHELAHYYRSHGTADGKIYNHFYRVDQHTIGARPAPDASLADLGKRVLAASKMRMPSSGSDDISDLADRAKIMTVMEEAIKKNLGQYTVEQEADELAVEWMAKLGLSLDAAIVAQIKLAEKYFNESSVYGWVSGVECRKSYESKWLDDKGQPRMVPVAAWNDIHHSPCFRAFNMEREIKAHEYNRSGKEAQGPGASWESLVKAAMPAAQPTSL